MIPNDYGETVSSHSKSMALRGRPAEIMAKPVKAVSLGQSRWNPGGIHFTAETHGCYNRSWALLETNRRNHRMDLLNTGLVVWFHSPGVTHPKSKGSETIPYLRPCTGVYWRPQIHNPKKKNWNTINYSIQLIHNPQRNI